MNLLKYSNGWGHLIMSIILLIVGLVLVIVPPDPTIKAVGTGLITSVAGYWLVTSAANQALRQPPPDEKQP